MISNYDFIFQNFENIVNYPILVSILPILLIGMIYLFGKIRLSNYWQYHLDDKYIIFMQGTVIINNYIFVPIISILFFYILVLNTTSILTKEFLCIALLLISVSIIQFLSNKILLNKINSDTKLDDIKLNLEKLNYIFLNWKKILILSIVKYIFPIILYLIIYFTLIYTNNKLILIIIGFSWFLCMIYFSILDTNLERDKLTSIILKNKKKVISNVKIIEFLNNGQLIKFEDENKKVSVIQTVDIEEIKLN